MKCFNDFLESAVDVRRQGEENPNSSVVAETMKLLPNSCCGYQNMDWSRRFDTKYLNVDMTLAFINNKLLEGLAHINDQLYEIELEKSEFEHKEPIILGFMIAQNTKLKMFELY